MGSPNIRQANNRRVTAFAHVLTYGGMGSGQVGGQMSEVVKRAGCMRRCGVIASLIGEEKDPWIAS